MKPTYTTVDQYIDSFPPEVRSLLTQIRTVIGQEAPQAVESISYGMAAYKLKGRPLVYFAAFANHIGFYATPSCQRTFAAQLAAYKQGKGSVQFPLDRPVPFELIRKMVAFKVKEQALR